MTNAQVKADIAANLPDNTSGAITPAKLRTEMGKMVDYSDTAATGGTVDTTARTAAANALARANHTGTQAASTITGLGALATAPVTISTEAPSGTPATGAIWFQYTA